MYRLLKIAIKMFLNLDKGLLKKIGIWKDKMFVVIFK